MNNTFRKRKLGDRLFKSYLAVTSTILLALGSQYLLKIKSEKFSERVNSGNIERIIEEEKSNLGLNNISVEGKLVSPNNLSKMGGVPINGYCDKLKSDSYAIFLNQDKATRDIVRHELFHIARGCLETTHYSQTSFGGQPISYWFIEEPLADIYAATKFKFTKLPLLIVEEDEG